MSNRSKSNRRSARKNQRSTPRPTAVAVLEREDEELDLDTEAQEESRIEKGGVVDTSGDTDDKPAKKGFLARRRQKKADKADTSKGRDLNLSERAHLRLGAGGVKTLNFGLGLAVTLAVIVIIYVMLWTTISMIIPSVAAGLLNFSGTSPDTVRFDALMAVWFAPLLFVVFMIAAGEIYLMRKIWSLGVRVREELAAKLGVSSEKESAEIDTKTTIQSSKRSKKKEK